MIKKLTYKGIRLTPVEIDAWGMNSCRGCYFNSAEVVGIKCSRPYDHGGVLRCTEEYEGDFVEDPDDPDGGYYETIETLYIWEIEKEMNKLTVTL